MANSSISQIKHQIAALKRLRETLTQVLADTNITIHQLQNEAHSEQPRPTRRSNRRAPPGVKITRAKGREYYYDRLTGERIEMPDIVTLIANLDSSSISEEWINDPRTMQSFDEDE